MEYLEKRNFPLTVVLYPFLLVVVGCYGSVDPEQLGLTPDGGVDVTSFDDLEIVGTLDDGNGPGPVTGPLDLAMLQVSLLSRCYDELVVDGDYQETEGPIHDVCEASNGLDFIDFQDEDGCHSNICAQQLFLCLGLKNQELAEAVAPVEFATRPFTIDSSSSFLFADGSFRIRLYYSGWNYPRINEHEYTIPPQEPQNRTLLLRAATFAFREAGVRGMLAAGVDDLTSERRCQWSSSAGAPAFDDIVFDPVSERSETSEATFADIYIVGLAETLERLDEAAGQTSENERSVAATLPGRSGNRYELVQRQWQGEINSQSSALALMAASANPVAAREALPPVVIDGQRAPTRRAIALLRAAAVNIDIDEGRTNEEVMDDVVAVLNPLSPESGVELEPDQALRAAETTWADISLAREYLLQERRALKRTVTEIPEAGPIARYYGFQEPSSQVGGDVILTTVSNAPHNLLKSVSEFDVDTVWVQEEDDAEDVNVTKNLSAGPFEASGSMSADFVSFPIKQTVYLSQDVKLPDGAEEVTFSVYIKAYSPDTVNNLLIEIEDGCSTPPEIEVYVADTVNWSRPSVTLALPADCHQVTVRIRHESADMGYSFYAWGAQLEVGARAQPLGHGRDESIPVLSRSYMEQSVRHGLDGLRQAAVSLQRQIADPEHACQVNDDCNDYNEILTITVREGIHVVGRYRSGWQNPCDDEYDEVMLTVCGVEDGQPLYVVRGEEGLACVRTRPFSEASCEGDVDDYIIDRTGPEFEYVEDEDPEDDAIPGFCATFGPFDVSDGEPLYVLTHELRIGSSIAGHNHTDRWETVGFYPGGCGDEQSPDGKATGDSDDTTRDLDNAGDSESAACIDNLSNDFVPPLENELTEDSDPYENSWRHYLNIARRAADNADALCDRLISEGLEMDMRSEAARTEIAQLCGASVDGDFASGEGICAEGDSECHGRLATCVSSDDENSPTYRHDYVSLGNPICIFNHEDFGPCRCDPRDESCDDTSIVCPIVLEDPPVVDEDDPESQDAADLLCQQAYEDSQGLDVDWTQNPGDPPAYSFRFVGKSLNLFHTPPGLVRHGVNCNRLHELRDGSVVTDSGPSDPMYELSKISWINPLTLSRVARSLELKQLYPHHFALVQGQKVLASTYYKTCPLRYPWREEDDGTNSVNNAVYIQPYSGRGSTWLIQDSVLNKTINCHTESPCSESDEDYLCSWNDTFGLPGRERVYWAEHIAWALTYLQTLGGVEETTSPPMGITQIDNTPLGVLIQEIGGTCSLAGGSRDIVGGYGADEISGLPIVTASGYEYTDTRGPGPDNDILCPSYQAIFVDCCDDRWGGLGIGVGPCMGDYSSSAWRDENCPGRTFLDNLIASRYILYSRRSQYRDVQYPMPSNRIWDGSVFADFFGSTNLIQEDHADYDTNFHDAIWGDSSCQPRARALPINDCGEDDEIFPIEVPRYSPYFEQLDNRDSRFHTAGLWDALELACWSQETEGSICPDALSIESLDDLGNASAYLECVAQEIHMDMSRQFIANIPNALFDGFLHSGTESYYPGFAGQQLEAMLQIEHALQRMAEDVQAVEHALRMAAADITVARAEIKIADINRQRALAELLERQIHAIIDIARSVGNALASKSGIGGSVSVGAAVADAIVIAQFNELYEELGNELHEEQVTLALGNLNRALGSRLEAIIAARASISNAFQDAQIGLSRLETNETRVEQLLAQASLADHDVTGRAWNVNTVMRRRYNTTRVRYDNALDRARTSAFLARRAIEFRLGLRFEEMDSDLTLVGAPSGWEEQYCTLGGCDYDRIRTGSEDVSEDVDEYPDYHDAYIGQYVDWLEDLVETYSIDFPFSDSDEMTVLSLRELAASQTLACFEEHGNPNLLYHSDEITATGYMGDGDDTSGRYEWVRSGCEEYGDDPAVTHYDRCLDVISNDPDPRAYYCAGSFCFTAERILDTDVSEASPRPYSAQSSGYVVQRVTGLGPGIYLLTYWIRDGEEERGESPLPPSPAPVYLAQVVDDVTDEVIQSMELTPDDDWEQVFFYFELEPGQQDIQIQFHPTSNDSVVVERGEPDCTEGTPDCTEPNTAGIPLGNILLGAVQLLFAQPPEAFSGCTSDDVSCLDVVSGDPEVRGSYSWDECCYEPQDYFRTSYTRGKLVPCVDPTNYDFQSAFIRSCEDRDGVICDPDRDSECWCYRQLTFPLLLSQIESGDLFQTRPLATHNYNYRHGRIALNLQGSNIISCDPGSSSSCYSDGTLQFTMEHRGTDMPVRAWDGSTHLFDLPTGRIQRGRALAAEIVPTNPMSGSQRALFEDFWKEELRGRPLQGIYTIRIWEDDALQWSNVEDIQLLLDYRYWTRFGD
jgi:hypothetical protein